MCHVTSGCFLPRPQLPYSLSCWFTSQSSSASVWCFTPQHPLSPRPVFLCPYSRAPSMCSSASHTWCSCPQLRAALSPAVLVIPPVQPLRPTDPNRTCTHINSSVTGKEAGEEEALQCLPFSDSFDPAHVNGALMLGWKFPLPLSTCLIPFSVLEFTSPQFIPLEPEMNCY